MIDKKPVHPRHASGPASGPARATASAGILALGAIFLLSGSLGMPAAARADPGLAQRIDAGIAPYFRPDAPGATVLVARDGKTVFRKAYGRADLETGRALEPGTVLRIGSLTKQFTAAAILLLAEQGRLSLDDDFRKFLPHYRDPGGTITLEHLLTHTSGIPSYTDLPGYIDGMARDMTVAQMIASFQDAPRLFEPGTRFAYSNSGYFLLGAVIEKVSGRSYADFVAQNIFAPLDMRCSAYEGHARHKVAQARGYRAVAGKFGPHAPLSMTQPYAAGSLVSCVDDLARWDAAITAGRLLKPASWARAFTPHKPGGGAPDGHGHGHGHGYGWAMGALKGSPTIGHGGGINGFSSYAMRLPQEQVYVAVLLNSESGVADPALIAHTAAGIAIGKPLGGAGPAAPAPLAPAVFDAYVGKYALAPGFVIEILRDGGRYLAKTNDEEPVEMFPRSDTLFYSTTVEAQLRFERGADGAAGRLILMQGGREMPGNRLE
ncbi:serine hydrolase [Massilia glaciei]|nr:serine hydrolase [Massilia glaciei]